MPDPGIHISSKAGLSQNCLDLIMLLCAFIIIITKVFQTEEMPAY